MQSNVLFACLISGTQIARERLFAAMTSPVEVTVTVQPQEPPEQPAATQLDLLCSSDHSVRVTRML